MLIAIISDTHDNEATLQLALNFLRQNPVVALIHCGDITTPETLTLLATEFRQPIHVVYGNCDLDRDGFTAVAKQFPHVTIHGDSGDATFGKSRIAFTHYPETAKQLTTINYQLIFYGHTHQPWEEKINACTVLNPGTLAGLWSKPTFALVDLATGKATLKLVERLTASGEN